MMHVSATASTTNTINTMEEPQLLDDSNVEIMNGLPVYSHYMKDRLKSEISTMEQKLCRDAISMMEKAEENIDAQHMITIHNILNAWKMHILKKTVAEYMITQLILEPTPYVQYLFVEYFENAEMLDEKKELLGLYERMHMNIVQMDIV